MYNPYHTMPNETDMKRTYLEELLGSTTPWKDINDKFSPKEEYSDTTLDLETTSDFPYSVTCAESAKVYYPQELARPHLNFFQQKTNSHTLKHTIKCPRGDSIKIAMIPWQTHLVVSCCSLKRSP